MSLCVKALAASLRASTGEKVLPTCSMTLLTLDKSVGAVYIQHMKATLKLLHDHVDLFLSVTCQTLSVPQGVMWLPGKVTSTVPTASERMCCKQVDGPGPYTGQGGACLKSVYGVLHAPVTCRRTS